MGLFSKRIEKQIESYQHELIETHYREAVSYTHLTLPTKLEV